MATWTWARRGFFELVRHGRRGADDPQGTALDELDKDVVALALAELSSGFAKIRNGRFLFEDFRFFFMKWLVREEALCREGLGNADFRRHRILSAERPYEQGRRRVQLHRPNSDVARRLRLNKASHVSSCAPASHAPKLVSWSSEAMCSYWPMDEGAC